VHQPIHYALRLVREAEIYTKRRVHKPLQLALLGQLIRVVVQQLDVLSVKVDELLVLVNALRRHRLGENGASSRDFVPSACIELGVRANHIP
jgi:hypothetical protein